MARKWHERMHDHPDLKPGWLYPMFVVAVERHRKPTAMRVTLEHLAEDQVGRTHECLLPLPILPGGLTVRFFQACGMNIEIGANVAPRDAVGREVWAEFAPAADGFEAVDFEECREDDPDESFPKPSTAPSNILPQEGPDDAGDERGIVR